MNARIPAVLLVCTLFAASEKAFADYPKLAPFSAVRWQGAVPEVQVGDDTWYQLIAINDVPRKRIVGFCKETWPSKWSKRFEEDLVEVMARMDKPPGMTVRLELKNLKTKKKVVLDAVKMTGKNRRALWQARQAKSESSGPAPSRLSPGQAAADLAQLRKKLETEYSYLKLRNFDYAKAIDKLASQCKNGIAYDKFALELTRIMAGFGDGHSAVRGKSKWLPREYAQFVIEDLNGKLIALEPDRSALLHKKYPYLEKIDGVDAEDWVKAAGAIIAQGSPQFVRVGGIGISHWTRFVRDELGKDHSASIALTLANKQGKTKVRTVDVSAEPPQIFPRDVASDVREIKDGIAYLRIAEMSSDRNYLHSLARAMDQFRKYKGLIIDVRGNPGGSRYALRTLYPYFMHPKEKPTVVNVAKYRLRPGDDKSKKEGFLQNRLLYPDTYAEWQPYDREAIKKFADGFKPEWTPPANEFSEWHYMVISPMYGMGSLRFRGRAIILMDERCYSATDIFLGAFKGRKNVKLMGRASGGGSGRSQQVLLEHSGLKVRLSSMASFQPSGKLYDGNGVQPDIPHKWTLDDILGNTDSMLDAAVKELEKGA